MKNIYLCIFWILAFLIGLNTSQATQYRNGDGVGGGGGTQECLDSISSNIQNYNFGNTYHGGISGSEAVLVLNSYFRNRCDLYSVGADPSTMTGNLIPIYQPRRDIVLYYRIHSGTYGMPKISFFQSLILKANPMEKYGFMPSFYGGILRYGDMSIRMNNQAYLASMKPPFSTAPVVQWYIYLGRPMMVARDTLGQVTDVFIQNPLSSKDPKELAKNYLGEEWYHP